jgi:hypothetical protein
MENKLPSFEIVITDEKWLDGEHIVYKLSYDTMTICNKLHPASAVLDFYADKKVTHDSIYILKPDKFYSDVAIRLSGVNKKKLIQKFDRIKVTFKKNGTAEEYEFKF